MITVAIQMDPGIYICSYASTEVWKFPTEADFFAFGPYHCILNERISGGIKEADPSVTCVRSIAEYAWVHLLTAVVRIIVDCIATKFHLENCKFSLCSTTQYPCLMWYTVSQSHSVTKSNLDVYVIVNCLPSCKLMKYNDTFYMLYVTKGPPLFLCNPYQAACSLCLNQELAGSLGILNRFVELSHKL